MIETVLWIVGILVYYSIGYFLALRNIPRSWALAREMWGTSDKNAKDDVRGGFITMFLFWWIRLPCSVARNQIDKIIVDRDPKELRRRVEELQTRTNELELELGYSLTKF